MLWPSCLHFSHQGWEVLLKGLCLPHRPREIWRVEIHQDPSTSAPVPFDPCSHEHKGGLQAVQVRPC